MPCCILRQFLFHAHLQKAASNEIRAMNAVIDAGLPSLHTTLSALLYVHGQRIMATAIAPIQGLTTLVYGSSDGGKHVFR